MSLWLRGTDRDTLLSEGPFCPPPDNLQAEKENGLNMTSKIQFRIDSKIRLTGAPQPIADEIRERFTLPNPLYVDAKKQGRWTGNLDAEVCFCHQEGNNLICPRGAARDVIKIASQVGEIRIIDNRLTLQAIDLTFTGNMRPYQDQAVTGILSKEFGVLEAGTGSGKTVMGLAIIAERKQPTLVLCHTKELIYQWQERTRQFLGIETGLIGDGHFDIQPVTIGIVNSVRANLDKLTPCFGHLVVDECHRVPSTLFTETVSAFPTRYSLGLSATPYRRDGLDKLIGWFVGQHRVTVDVAILRQVGAILRPKVIIRETEFRYPFNDDYSRMVSTLTEDPARNQMIVADIEQQAKQDGLALVVSDRTEHLSTLAGKVKVPARVLTGKTPKKQRKAIVEDLANGKISVLFSTLSLIGEGFDCPALDSLFLASPIKFSGRLKQVVGRVLRPAEGKIPMVYDYVDSKVGLLGYQAKARQKVYSTMQ